MLHQSAIVYENVTSSISNCLILHQLVIVCEGVSNCQCKCLLHHLYYCEMSNCICEAAVIVYEDVIHKLVMVHVGYCWCVGYSGS